MSVDSPQKHANPPMMCARCRSQTARLSVLVGGCGGTGGCRAAAEGDAGEARAGEVDGGGAERGGADGVLSSPPSAASLLLAGAGGGDSGALSSGVATEEGVAAAVGTASAGVTGVNLKTGGRQRRRRRRERRRSRGWCALPEYREHRVRNHKRQ